MSRISFGKTAYVSGTSSDILEEYEVPMQVLEVSLLELPLHVNDPRVLSQTIVKWRFERGI